MKTCFVILTPDRAEIYSPFRQEWYRLFVSSDEEEALQKAKAELAELAREDVIAQSFKSLIDGLKEKGFTLREILNGLAELAFREKYPNEVCSLLEKASDFAQERAVCENSNLALIREKLAAARPHLIEAINLIHHNNLAPLFSEIYSDIADAHFYFGEAISKIDEHPQPDQ